MPEELSSLAAVAEQLPEADAELIGGDFRAGKTSNVELDTILRTHLPEHLVLPCDTLPRLSHATAAKIAMRVTQHGKLYFLIFLRSHWIAGILTVNATDRLRLTVRDSAPSRYVHKDMIQLFKCFWPDIIITTVPSARQVRGSEECGLHMLMHFFADFLRVEVGDPAAVPNKLRSFMAAVARSRIPSSTFYEQLTDILTTKPRPSEASPLLGGGPDDEADHVKWVVEMAATHERDAASRNLCYLLVATALVNIAKGKKLEMKKDALSKRQSEMGFPPNTPNDVAEALQKFYTKNPLQVHRFGKDSLRAKPTVLDEWDRSLPYLFVQTHPDIRLPSTIEGRRFVAGARFYGGHYTVTRRASEAVVGVFKGKANPTQQQNTDTADDQDEAEYRRLRKEPEVCLNGRGGLQGAIARPHTWFVHNQQPPPPCNASGMGSSDGRSPQPAAQVGFRHPVDAYRPTTAATSKSNSRTGHADSSGAQMETVHPLDDADDHSRSSSQPSPVHKSKGRSRPSAGPGVESSSKNGGPSGTGDRGEPPTPVDKRRLRESSKSAATPKPTGVRLLDTHVAVRGQAEGDRGVEGEGSELARHGEWYDPCSAVYSEGQRSAIPGTVQDPDGNGGTGCGVATEAGGRTAERRTCLYVQGVQGTSTESAEEFRPATRSGFGAQGSSEVPGRQRNVSRPTHQRDGSHEPSHAQPLPGLWPPSYEGGRDHAGRRCRDPPKEEELGANVPDPKDLGISEASLLKLIREMEGKPPMVLPPMKEWPLHLKNTTLCDFSKVDAMVTQSEDTKLFFRRAQRYMSPETFVGLRTSRTIKTTKLATNDLERALEMGKFEEVGREEVVYDSSLMAGVHGVNVFTVPEMKGRRRCITEPHLNAVVAKSSVPSMSHPTRLESRQALKRCKWCVQLDFDAYYDSIPLDPSVRNLYVFRVGHRFFRLKTVPTGARWSVAVAQSITWVLTDVPTTVNIITCIDSIMIAAREDQREDFLRTVRAILLRIREANLLTTPDRESLLTASDDELLNMAVEDTTFLGEDYHWTGSERIVRNSAKTTAKLQLALEKTAHTRRSFVSLVSLIMFATHTTRINPSLGFYMLRACRGVFAAVSYGAEWDASLPYLGDAAAASLQRIGTELLKREWYTIVDPLRATYEESNYSVVCFTDASRGGWGAVALEEDGKTRAYQQRWVAEVNPSGPYRYDGVDAPFVARHSAHSEPRGTYVYLQQLLARGFTGPAQIAIVTDHFPIVHAQRKHNGFGGIGRGFELESLFRLTNDLLHDHNIFVVYFYVHGYLNPADSYSRNFGDLVNGALEVREVNTSLPLLKRNTFSPMCEEKRVGKFCGDRWNSRP